MVMDTLAQEATLPCSFFVCISQIVVKFYREKYRPRVQVFKQILKSEYRLFRKGSGNDNMENASC